MRYILNKIINFKISWIILGSLLIFLIIVLVFINSDSKKIIDNNNQDEVVINENIYFDLKGEEFVTLYLNEEYEEFGYTAYNEKFDDIESYVLIEGEVNTSEVGIYTINYILNYKNKLSKTLTRTVEVIERDYNDIILKLNGSDTIYIPINSNYEELGATAYLNEEDISSDIIITSNLNTNKIGGYEVTYYIRKNDVKKELTRQVIVFNVEDFFEVSTTKITNQDVSVDVIVNDFFRYIILPNKIVQENNIFTYKISSNGNYQFMLYDINGNLYTKTITINNIDKENPTGVCNATLYNDRIEVNANVNDNSGVFSYRYILDDTINELTYNNVYQTSSIKKAEKIDVEVVDNANNKTTLTCSITDSRGPVFINGNHCSDEYIYEGTKYSLTDKQKRKLAAMVKAEYGGGLIGMKAAASHMANLYEYKKWRGSTSKSFYNYISTTKWYAARTRNATSVNDNALKAVEDCIINGQRILPLYIDELDWFPYDIKSYKSPSYYVPGKTKISNKYGADGTFWCFTIYGNGEGNVFFYSSSSYKKYVESKEQ